jgi:hypothetical protein
VVVSTSTLTLIHPSTASNQHPPPPSSSSSSSSSSAFKLIFAVEAQLFVIFILAISFDSRIRSFQLPR